VGGSLELCVQGLELGLQVLQVFEFDGERDLERSLERGSE
jgi:hypothetical protein